MLNKEYYKDVSVNNLIISKDMETMHIRDFDRWLNSERSILDDKERRYLRCVVLPFYDDVKYIKKLKGIYGSFIKIVIKNREYSDTACLPYFDEDKMYCGMEYFEEYTLKELGIFK